MKGLVRRRFTAATIIWTLGASPYLGGCSPTDPVSERPEGVTDATRSLDGTTAGDAAKAEAEQARKAQEEAAAAVVAEQPKPRHLPQSKPEPEQQAPAEPTQESGGASTGHDYDYSYDYAPEPTHYESYDSSEGYGYDTYSKETDGSKTWSDSGDADYSSDEGSYEESYDGNGYVDDGYGEGYYDEYDATQNEIEDVYGPPEDLGYDESYE